ncbi:zinc-ribbon and DUF3426 domain-containing protein [Psychrobacter sp. DAB_AL62B]|uniref:zinc-ribbon and DUF3426 domain-containing protein n=1 Tax=Psychrobacter sp. DAB_AL62B TaxID=1028420 RepID=UPI0023814FBE|nr:zinc-ribbon and DUF3426 domain-containing protein [Psychrobacter sp. DAB_AL62B]MDE4454704.1 DUF3426 domain-containing protein [Psychrobacter sp. DAB_AL62B]
MTTPIKTQCPHCHASFNIKKTQLNQKTATVCCENCQQSFLVNNNLIVTADTDLNNKDITSINTASSRIGSDTESPSSNASTMLIDTDNSDLQSYRSKKSAADTLIHDDMIHDDMDIEADDDEELEYDSLDSMNAWLTQNTDSNHATTTNDTLQKKPSAKLDKNPYSSATILNTTSSATASLRDAPSSAQIALSSAASNDIHANINDNADESWLEKLLKEQNQNEDALKNETDLSQLLLSMGVSFKEEDSSNAAHAKKMQTQDKFSPTPARRSIASLLWLFGCLVLTLLLFAQYVIFNLDNLVKNPAYAERLQAICSIAACSLPSADLTALTMSNVKHQPSQIKAANTFSDVSVTLNNQSPQAQLYPHIKVSVYSANALIGEFIAAPNEYLLSTQSQLGAESRRQLLFTVPVANAQINKVDISPIY